VGPETTYDMGLLEADSASCFRTYVPNPPEPTSRTLRLGLKPKVITQGKETPTMECANTTNTALTSNSFFCIYDQTQSEFFSLNEMKKEGKTMNKMSRRAFLSHAGAWIAATPMILASSRSHAASESRPAPASSRRTLTVLLGTEFIAASERFIKDRARDWGKANGITVNVDMMNWTDLQAKVSAAIHGGGVDVVDLHPMWNYLYKNSLVDVTDIAEGFGSKFGGFLDWVVGSSRIEGRYFTVPTIAGAFSELVYRISWFKEAGADIPDLDTQIKQGKWPDMTWDQWFSIGKKLKAKGKPLGQALGHSTGDPPSFCYPYMWSYGAMEVEKDGKTIAFHKPMFVDGMKRFIQAWKDAFDETGLGWDDNANNRAFLGEQISSTINGSTIYLVAKKQKPALAEDTGHMPVPRGPQGRFYTLMSKGYAILKNSKNIDLAKEFLRWWFDEQGFYQQFLIKEGVGIPVTKKQAEDKIWEKDPKLFVFKEQGKYGRFYGYAGQLNEKASMAISKYIVIDTFAKAIQGGDAEGAIKWGAEQLQRIYGG
jgi:multiple sugar transport system substrate-binding protein